ncbi:MAG: dihydropteroate synthase [Chloroflexi bacterium]|nr:dihydropteroate synthase [Chloroflexota bacterium]MCL5110302.1 dihydropteroate synthase [Chloroflexota bacterium]
MLVVGERIHIISPKVKAAFEGRDTQLIQEMALNQVKAGAHILDLNIGPSKKQGPAIMEWLVPAVQAVTDVPLSLDTTNAVAMEAGLKLCKVKPVLNSASAEAARMQAMVGLAAEYNSDLVALTLTDKGIPNESSERAAVALDLIAAAAEAGIGTERIFLDPLTLPVSADQPGVMQTVEAVRIFGQLSDPPAKSIVGLSNVSNGSPNEVRGLINRVMLVMCLGAGLDAAIVDPLDHELLDWARIVEKRDESTAKGKLLVSLYDAVAAMEDLDPAAVDMSDQEQVEIFKTWQILANKIIYAHSFLRV